VPVTELKNPLRAEFPVPGQILPDLAGLPVRALVIDDMLSIHDLYREVLQSANGAAPRPHGSGDDGKSRPALSFIIDSAYQGQEGLALVRKALAEERPYAVVFVDMRMPPGWDGIETVRQLWGADPHLQVAICTGYTDYSWGPSIDRLNHSGDYIILQKPFRPFELRQAAATLAQKWLLARQLDARIAELERLARTRDLEVKRAEEGFTQVFNASPLAQSIIALDRFEVIAVNSAYERTLGLTVNDLSGTSPEKFGRGLDAGRWRGLMAKLASGLHVDDHPFTYLPAPGVVQEMRCTARLLTVHGRPCSIWVIRDVTEQVRLEEQMRQTQKMDAVGQLAAGVAHDFNNLLTAIQGFTEQALYQTTDGSMRSLLEPVLSSAKRAAILTRQLLLFSRKQAVNILPVDLATLVGDLKPVLRRLLPENIELVWDLPGSLPPVRADSANVEQVIINLAINARDALPSKGGSIRIGTGLREFATAEETRHVDGRAGRFVIVQVADNGSGIPPEVLPRIFEPFYTTKDIGKGTGLGLSTVYSVARQHQGWIDVQTSVGSGTTFTVYHPVATLETAGTDGAEAETPGSRLVPGSLSRVLAVDDDPSIQSILRMMFETNGINAVIAPDATQALNLWNAHEGRFDLLITDVVMPNGTSGIELARTLRQRDPGLKIILMTGYSSDLLSPDRLAMPGKMPHLLFKPFDRAEVLKAIASA
jgi:two-component system cell cycle sensor histidine kinase/response regulator CckA